jgi:hypothetical protein
MLEITAPSTSFGGLRVPDVVVRPRYVPYVIGSNDTPLTTGTLVEFYLKDAVSGGEVWKDDAAFLDSQNPKCGFNNVYATGSEDDVGLFGITVNGVSGWGKYPDVLIQGVCTAKIYILNVSASGTFPAGTLLYSYTGVSGSLAPPLPFLVSESGRRPLAMLLEPISYTQSVALNTTAKVLFKQPYFGSGAG